MKKLYHGISFLANYQNANFDRDILVVRNVKGGRGKIYQQGRE